MGVNEVKIIKHHIYEKYGECTRCHRYLKLNVLIQIEDYVGHVLPGTFHHKLICISCKEKSDEASEQMLMELEEEETYNGTPISEIKVGGTD